MGADRLNAPSFHFLSSIRQRASTSQNAVWCRNRGRLTSSIDNALGPSPRDTRTLARPWTSNRVMGSTSPPSASVRAASFWPFKASSVQ